MTNSLAKSLKNIYEGVYILNINVTKDLKMPMKKKLNKSHQIYFSWILL